MLQAYELQLASGGRWTSVFSTSGNNLQATEFVGPAVLGTALRIRMTRVGCVCGGHLRGPCDWHVWPFESFASLTPHLATAADMQCKLLSLHVAGVLCGILGLLAQLCYQRYSGFC